MMTVIDICMVLDRTIRDFRAECGLNKLDFRAEYGLNKLDFRA